VLIEDELSRNLVNLLDSSVHHRAQLDYYTEYLENHSEMTEENYAEVFRHFYSKGVFRPAMITQTGWDIAKYTGITSKMDVKTLRTLNDMFTKHEMYQLLWSQGMTAHALAGVISGKKKTQVLATVDTINEALRRESLLVSATEKCLTYVRTLN